MSDYLVNRLLGTPLYEGHGEPSDIPEQAADEITALRERLEQAERDRDNYNAMYEQALIIATQSRKYGFRAGIEAAAERLEESMTIDGARKVIRALSPADNTATVAEAAKVLLNAWRNSETVTADDEAQNTADLYEVSIDAFSIVESWLHALAEQTGGD